MRDSQIRSSLHYLTYIEHSESLKLAADDNLPRVIELYKTWHLENNRVKVLGLISATLLLYALSIELILKARALYIEKERIKSGEIDSYKSFLKQWKGKSNGHDVEKLIEHYKIQLSENDKDLIGNFKQHMIWAGRFPYPINEEQTQAMEKSGRKTGSINKQHEEIVQAFIDKQKFEIFK